jgi:hypothetical protein
MTSEPISVEEARARLSALAGKPNASRLAREWRWTRARTRRLIERCRAEGVIPKANGHDASASAPASPSPGPATPATPGTQMTVHQPPPAANDATLDLNELWRDLPDFDEPRELPAPRPPGTRLLAGVLFAAACMLGLVGLVLNATFAHSLGRSELSADILAVLGAILDVMTVVLPPVAAEFWHREWRPAAMAAWLVWGGCLIMTLIAASSFAATNIGDSTRSRADIVSSREGFAEKLKLMRDDRKAITEARAPDAIQAAIQQEQGRIPTSNWKSSAGCTNVTISARYCEKINTLRQAKADAERRDQLDADITRAADELGRLPPVAAADPGAEMAAKLVRTSTFGLVNATAAAIQDIRIAGLTLAPAISGWLLMFASLIWRTRRDDEPIEPIV